MMRCEGVACVCACRALRCRQCRSACSLLRTRPTLLLNNMVCAPPIYAYTHTQMRMSIPLFCYSLPSSTHLECFKRGILRPFDCDCCSLQSYVRRCVE